MKSKILQLNNDYIQEELKKNYLKEEENKRKNRFMASILILVVFLFVLPTYNLIESYKELKDNEQQLVELRKRHDELSEVAKSESSLIKKLENEEYAAKYFRAKYQYSKDYETVYNIPGLLPK